jgi:hypothetical protein
MAMATGTLTITVSGTRRGFKQTEVIAKCVFATALYPASGVPLPTTPNDWGLKSRVDSIEWFSLASNKTNFRAEWDRTVERMKIYRPYLTSLTGVAERQVTTASGASGMKAFMVKVRGF